MSGYSQASCIEQGESDFRGFAIIGIRAAILGAVPAGELPNVVLAGCLFARFTAA